MQGDGSYTYVCPACKAKPARALRLGGKDVPSGISSLFGNTLKAAGPSARDAARDFQRKQKNCLLNNWNRKVAMDINRSYSAEVRPTHALTMS